MPVLHPSTEPADEAIYARRALLLAGVIYPVWGLFCFWLLPGHQEPFIWRLVFSGGCFALVGASYAFPTVARRLPAVLLPVYIALTLHYMAVVVLNHLGAVYLVGTFITVAAIDALLRTSRGLLVYSAILLPAS